MHTVNQHLFPNNKFHELSTIDHDHRPLMHPVPIVYNYHVVFHYTIHIECQQILPTDLSFPKIMYALGHVNIYLQKNNLLHIN